MMRLSSLISDEMILQRDVENSIWGDMVKRGRTVELSFENFQVKTICADDGYFELMIPGNACRRSVGVQDDRWGRRTCDS